MEFAGIQWEVASGAVSGSGWQREVHVADYAKYGVGLYRVRGISTGAGACEAEALVRITGRNPLSTFAGIIALIATAGAAAVAANSARAAARFAGGAVR